MKKFIFGTVVGSGTALLLAMLRNAHNIKEKRHSIKLQSVKGFQPFRLLFIADVHRKKLPEDFFGQRADAVIIGGDLTERGVPLKRTADNLRILTRVAPAYFVWGNHDEYVGERNLRKLLAHYGVKILENESAELFGQPHLKIVGVDFFSDPEVKMEKAFAEVRPEDTVLFASHAPAMFKLMHKAGNPQLSLAGHLHGGQIRLGKLGLFKKGSLEKRSTGYELITNGYGTSSLPLRLGAEAQYHVIDVFPDRFIGFGE